MLVEVGNRLYRVVRGERVVIERVRLEGPAVVTLSRVTLSKRDGNRLLSPQGFLQAREIDKIPFLYDAGMKRRVAS